MATVTKEKRAAERVAAVLGHPLRIDALRMLSEEVLSPNAISRRLHQPLANVSYHIRTLRKKGYIELVRTEDVRGATEHFYRATQRAEISDEEWALMLPEARAEVSSLALLALFSEAHSGLSAGSFDSRNDRHLSWRPLTLDEQGWAEFTKTLLCALRGVEEVQARSDARRLESGEEPITAICGMLGFERAPLPEPRRSRSR
jgi:DNA-binding transcriptional ArsR family regulator